MKTKSLMIAIALFALVMGMTASAYAAVTIKLILSTTDATAATATNALDSITTIAPGQRFFVIAQVSDATSIAGAAFTLSYDSSKFEVIQQNATTASAPGTVVSDGEADRGLDILGSDLYGAYTDDRSGATVAQDIIRLTKVDSANGKVMFSGAGINKTTGTGSATGAKNLFRIRFRAKSTATGTGTFSLGQTTLTNTSAGYSASGETIPALIGAAANTNSTVWSNLTTTTDCSTSAFCTIAATFDNSAGSLTIQGYPGIVRPGATDTKPTFGDVLYLYYHYKCLTNPAASNCANVKTLAGNGDYSHNGQVDFGDILMLFYYYKGQPPAANPTLE